MKKLKVSIIILFLSCFLLPTPVALAQTVFPEENPTEITQNVDAEKEKDKKKDDKGDKLEIDNTFYVNFLINLATILLLVVFIYYRNYKNKEAMFTYFLFNIAIFLLTYLMNQIKISMGAAFGLFAVFSMLRYRTEGISMKDMTYLFLVISVGLVSAIRLNVSQLLIINGIVVVSTFLLDGNIFYKREYSKRVVYDRIDRIQPEKHHEMIEDLRIRTGLNIRRISIVKIDFLRDIALIDVYYSNKGGKNIKETNTSELVSTNGES